MTTTIATGTTSRPANGFGGFSDADWLLFFGAFDGIVMDTGGNALAMTLLNSDEAAFTAATVSVDGYVLTVPEGTRVSLPAPSSGTVTYHIGVLYDPSLNVTVLGSDGVTPTATVQGPCRLAAYDTVDATGSKRFLIMYSVTRSTAALTGATVLDRRRWASCAVDWPYGGSDDFAPGTDGNSPRGTIRFYKDRLLVRSLNAAGVLAWVDPLAAGPFSFPFKSGFVARNSSGNKVTYSKHAGLVKLKGDVQRSSGNFSSELDVGFLPAGYRPDTLERFVCKTSGAGGQCEVTVSPSNGAVTVTDNGQSFSWINLSPVIFEAVN